MPAPELYRHTLATIAYRFQKSVRNAKPDYPVFEAGEGVRKPIDILHHMRLVLEYAKAIFTQQERLKPNRLTWEEEINHFHDLLEELDESLVNLEIEESILKKALQGPLSDVLTHIGQLATLRRLSGDPISGESYVKANIQVQNLGKDQPLQS